jgi:hypothetical protein
MSHALLNRVLAAPQPRDALERLLLAAIAYGVNKNTGIYYASHTSLGRCICRSERTVRRVLRKLESARHLIIDRRRGASNVYRLPAATETRTPDSMMAGVPTPATMVTTPPDSMMAAIPPITHRSRHRDETYGSTTRARGGRKIAARWRPGPAGGPERSA